MDNRPYISIYKTILKYIHIVLLLLPLQLLHAEVIELHGAAQFDASHPYTKALEKFVDLVQKNYQGEHTLKFILHPNSELGTEKDYFGYMNLGVAVDFAIVSPSHMSTFSPEANIMDVPFLFHDVDHYLRAIRQDVFAPVEQALMVDADVLVLGYGGGEKRHLIGTKPVDTLDKLSGFTMRVQGSPVQTLVFGAIGATPTVISGGEVYNAIQTGVIDGAENSPNAIRQYKWFEVAPHYTLSTVSITVRPLIFSGKSFRKLPTDLQEVIRKAGPEVMAYERDLEISTDGRVLKELRNEGRIKTYEFQSLEELVRLAQPVQTEFAKGIGAYDVLQAIRDLR